MSDATRNKLKTVSTATVATALFKRGFRIQMIQDVHPLGPDQPVLVGEAFTLRYMPAREDLNKIDVFRDRSHPQRKAIEDCPVGAVLVMDSRKDARAASAGAILVTRLMKRGCAGVITDGGFRDSAEIARLGFPAYHHRPSAPTNLTLHQAIEINVPIGCGDAPVFPGDVILGDSDGVIVIPAHLADEIADETVEMTAFEDFVTEQVQNGRSIFGLYPATDEQDADRFRGVAEEERAIVLVPRTQRSAPPLWRGALQSRGPGEGKSWVPALRCTAEEALHRVRDTNAYTRPPSPPFPPPTTQTHRRSRSRRAG